MKKLIPRALCVRVGSRSAVLPVETIVAFRPWTHPPNCPIDASLVAVRFTVSGGAVHWYGFTTFRINSHFQMEVSGFDPNFEEVAKWEDAPDE